MSLSKLEEARDYEVEQYLEEALQLSPYQKDKLRNYDVIRLSPFRYFKRKEIEAASALWRVTAPFFIIFIIASFFIVMPIKWALTGKYYFNHKGAYAMMMTKWNNKLKFNLA